MSCGCRKRWVLCEHNYPNSEHSSESEIGRCGGPWAGEGLRPHLPGAKPTYPSPSAQPGSLDLQTRL